MQVTCVCTYVWLQVCVYISPMYICVVFNMLCCSTLCCMICSCSTAPLLLFLRKPSSVPHAGNWLWQLCCLVLLSLLYKMFVMQQDPAEHLRANPEMKNGRATCTERTIPMFCGAFSGYRPKSFKLRSAGLEPRLKQSSG